MLVLVGASASGKSEIVKELYKNFGLVKYITCTTRPARVGETNDVDYHFFDKQTFEEKIKKDEFVEYVTYNGYYYGTLKSEIEDNKAVILEPNGFLSFKNSNQKIYSVYLNVNEEVRYDRMIKRGDSSENAKNRILEDRKVFTKDIMLHADFILDTTFKTPNECANIIYDLYKKSLNNL